MKKREINNKKKSFYFEDYSESEFFEDNNRNNIKISKSRVTFLFFIFVSLILVFSIKIIFLSLSKEKNFYSNTVSNSLTKERRDIVDRNNSILATNVNLYDVGIRPKLLKEEDKKKLLIKLNLLFPEMDFKKIKANLKENKFFWIASKFTT